MIKLVNRIFVVLMFFYPCVAFSIPVSVDFSAFTRNVSGHVGTPPRATGNFTFEPDELIGRRIYQKRYSYSETVNSDLASMDISLLNGGFSYEYLLRDIDKEGTYFPDHSKISILAWDESDYGYEDMFQIQIYNYYKHYNQQTGIHNHQYSYMYLNIVSDNPDFIIDGKLPVDFSEQWLGDYRASGYYKVSDQVFEDIPEDSQHLRQISSLRTHGEFIIDSFVPNASIPESPAAVIFIISFILMICLRLKLMVKVI